MKDLSEKPIERKEGDPKSPFPSNMLRVDIPKGAILVVAQKQGGEVRKEFGVSHMMHGMVSRASGEPTEGTVLWFNGETFRVDVGRRDLTAEEINHIAKLSMDLDGIITVLNSLPRQIEGAEKLIKDLAVSKNIFKDRSANFKFDPTEAIAELGILISKMKPSLVEQQEQWRKVISELASLDVTQVRDGGGGLLAGVPIEDMATKFAAEAQKS